MRHFMLFAISAIALSTASLGQANAGPSAGAAGLLGATGQLSITELVAKVCKDVCRGNVCRERCFNERDRDEVVHERVYRERDDREEHRDRDRKPGVEFHVPGVNIEAR